MATDNDDLRLIGRLTVDVEETALRFRRQGLTILIGSVIVASLAALRGVWFLVPICLVFGAGLYALGRLASKRSGPARAAPVLRALREAPQRIKSITHHETSDSMRLFVSHWVVVTSDDGGVLRVRANDDWEQLVANLATRCPQAVLKTS